MRRWVVALGALHTESIGRKAHHLLGGMESVVERHDANKEALRAFAGIDTEARVRELLARPPTPFDALAHHAALTDLPHADLTRRKWVAWDAHRALTIAGLARLAGMGEGRLLAALGPVAGRVCSTYSSWREYGWHVLLGEAASTGEWSEPLERAYHALCDRDDGPWQTTPWDAYSPRAEGPIATRVQILVRCTRCMGWVVLDRVARELLCSSCFRAITLPSSLWEGLRRDLDEARAWPVGFHDAHHHYEDDLEIEVDVVNVPPPHPHVAARTVDVPFASGPVTISGETDRVTSAAKVDGRVVLSCESCGSPLSVERERDVACKYCRHETRVPDELWSRLYPAPLTTRLTFVF